VENYPLLSTLSIVPYIAAADRPPAVSARSLQLKLAEHDFQRWSKTLYRPVSMRTGLGESDVLFYRHGAVTGRAKSNRLKA